MTSGRPSSAATVANHVTAPIVATPHTTRAARLRHRRMRFSVSASQPGCSRRILRQMTRGFAILVTLAWALWFGGMVFLFVALASIFTTRGFDREAAGAFAAGLFPKFERMQLLFAAVSLVGTFGWWLASRSRAKLVLFTLFGLATVAAVAETTLVTPRVESLRLAGQRGTARFERMHQISLR